MKNNQILLIAYAGVTLPLLAGSHTDQFVGNLKQGSLFPVLSETAREAEIKKLDTAQNKGAIENQLSKVKNSLLKAKIFHPKYATAGIVSGVVITTAAAVIGAKNAFSNRPGASGVNFEDFDTPDQAINTAVQSAPVKKVQPAKKRVSPVLKQREVVVSSTPGLDTIIDTARKSLHGLKTSEFPGGEIMSMYWSPEVQADVEKLSPNAQQALHKVCIDYDCNIMTQAAASERARELRQEGYRVDQFGIAHKDGNMIAVRSKVQDGARLVKVFNQCKRQLIDHA